jgi:recombination DNA repair RAD52 pathway protein
MCCTYFYHVFRANGILDINRSIELANFYIGFNQWSSSIVSLVQESFEFLEESQQFRCSYCCTVRLELRDGRNTESKGRATTAGKDKSVIIEFAKKKAVTEAKRNVFQTIFIVLLKSGKVAVELLETEMEHM